MSASTQIRFSKALLIRLDRIGDLILTLPVDQLESFTHTKVTWAISPGMEFLADQAEPPRKHIQLDRKFSRKKFFDFLAYLKKEHFDLAIVFHGPWWVGLALWLAHVPYRVGVRSQWHSFVFFNRGVRQKRSHALFHESEYNRRLVISGLRLHGNTEALKPLHLRPSQVNLTEKLGLRFTDYFVVHAGMAGSARNWTTPLYVELVEKLLKKDNVVLTFSKTDHAWVDPIIEKIGEHPRLQWMEINTAEDWLFILTFAKAVLAPSTGTVHVAAALGTPTVGLYSPVRVQSPKRWAPLGGSVQVIWPDVECPGHWRCLMENCPRFDCMRDIGADEVFAALHKMSEKIPEKKT